MSATDRDALVVEALAAIHAASSVLNVLCEYDEEVFSGLGERLRNELFPADRSDPEWYLTDAIEVEIAARSAELEALALEDYVEGKAAEEAYNIRAPYAKRIEPRSSLRVIVSEWITTQDFALAMNGVEETP